MGQRHGKCKVTARRFATPLPTPSQFAGISLVGWESRQEALANGGQAMSKLAPTSMPMSAGTKVTVHVPHDQIAMRAYEKWIQHGRQHGRHMQDWLEAEHELQAEHGRG